MLMKTTLCISMTIVGVLVSMTGASFAQATNSTNKASCSLIEKQRLPQYISYEGSDRDAAFVTLRLHNNTTCSILVETDDKYSTRLIKLPRDQSKTEIIDRPQDGVRLPLHYLVQDRRRSKAPEPAYGWGDSVFTYEIVAGQSIIFAVPLFHFEKHLDLAVPFNYSWEDRRSVGMGDGAVVHRVYFLADELPRSAASRRNVH